MKEKEKVVVTGLTLLMLILLFGFVVHVSPRFAGSFWGGVLGIVGALLMLIPLLYMVIKRIKWLKTRITKRISMKTWLAWHVYAGIVGPILVVLHTGHKFASPLGIALTALTVVVVLSGFVGRYLMSQFSKEIREKKAMLTELQAAYSHAQTELAQNRAQANLLQPYSGFVSRLVGSFFLTDDAGSVAVQTGPSRLLRVTESIADVEYAITTHEKFKSWFGKWLVREVAKTAHHHFFCPLRLDDISHLGGNSFWSALVRLLDSVDLGPRSGRRDLAGQGR